MTGRIPYAQPLTLDFNKVTVLWPERGRRLLGIDDLVRALQAADAVLRAELASVRAALAVLRGEFDALPDGGGSGSSAVLVGQATVDFGSTEDSNTAVSVAAPSVVAGQRVCVSLAAESTADHDALDAGLEGLLATVGAVSPGVGFVVNVFAPAGTWGRYKVNYLIA